MEIKRKVEKIFWIIIGLATMQLTLFLIMAALLAIVYFLKVWKT